VPETLTAPDGQVIDAEIVDEVPEFNAAMAAPEPGQKPDYPGPRKRDSGAPHGRNEDGSPKTPYGLKPNGQPRVVPPGPGRGKTGTADGARVQNAKDLKETAKPGKQAGTAEDPAAATARRAADAQTTLELLSAGGTLWSMFSLTRSQAAYKLADSKGDKAGMAKSEKAYARAQVTQLDAAAFALHAEGVGQSAAAAAGQNAMAAALVDRLALFNGVASVGLAVLPLVYQIVANHAPREVKDDFPAELLTLGVLPPNLLLEKLQAQSAVKMARAQTEILAEKQAAEAELEALREQAA
jgi:hypothetical protein